MIDQEQAARAFRLTSPDFQDNGPLPERSAYDQAGCHGLNTAPTLVWEHVPAGTHSFALLMNDTDAPVAGGFHRLRGLQYPGGGPHTRGQCLF